MLDMVSDNTGPDIASTEATAPLFQEEMRALAQRLCKEYAAHSTEHGVFPIADEGSITATEAMIVCTALLRAVDVQVFELGIWQDWIGGAG